MGNIRTALRWKSEYVQLWLVVGALLAVVWGGIYLDLQRARDEILAGNRSELNNLALAFSKEIESSIKTVDMALLDLREHWDGDTRRFAAAVRHRQSYLEKELAFQVAVIDAKGILVFSSLEQPTQPVDLSDREHFRVHRQKSADELFISKPLLGRISKRWSIQFTRPIYDRSDHFSGVLVLSVSPEYFYRFYRSIRLPPDSAITLILQDGAILARYPTPEGALGKTLTGAPFNDPLSPEVGLFQRPSQVDGIDRVYAWRRMEHPQLVVIVGHSIRDIMEPYREQSYRAIVAGIGLSILLLLVAYLKLISLRQRRKSAEALADNEERWRLALEAAGDGVWDWDMASNRVVFSVGWKKMLGYEVDEIGNQLEEWKRRVHPDDMPQVMQDIQDHFEGRAPVYANEHRVLCKDGSWKWILDRGMVMVRGRDGLPLRMVGTHTDISARKEMEAMLKNLATTDALTGLNNRRSFLENLEEEIARVRRYPQSSAAVLMADIDFFKKINDTYGHAAGDAALKHFAALLRNTARETDAVGRLGGEEFAVLLPETSVANAERFAQRLCALLREAPVMAGEHSISMTVSIGISMANGNDTGGEQVLHRADIALYEAKHNGRDQVVVNSHDLI
ncbi:MAG TPA: diguanylate cyclase [Rhodocyclaceae bacterium]|nr:diguanylate cyclase [Rhodocyclaceae bacterium]